MEISVTTQLFQFEFRLAISVSIKGDILSQNFISAVEHDITNSRAVVWVAALLHGPVQGLCATC